MSTNLSERYSSPPAWQRRALLSAVIGVAVVALGWLTWAMWFHSTPTISSELVAFEVTSDHEAIAKIRIATSGDEANGDCKVRALAADHSVVGDKSWEGRAGLIEVAIRTERRATSVDLIGCTTPDQRRPR